MNLLAKRFMPATIKELALWSTGLESAFDSGGWEESCLRPLECCNIYLSRNQQWNVTIEHHLHTPKNVVSETRQLPKKPCLSRSTVGNVPQFMWEEYVSQIPWYPRKQRGGHVRSSGTMDLLMLVDGLLLLQKEKIPTRGGQAGARSNLMQAVSFYTEYIEVNNVSLHYCY